MTTAGGSAVMETVGPAYPVTDMGSLACVSVLPSTAGDVEVGPKYEQGFRVKARLPLSTSVA